MPRNGVARMLPATERHLSRQPFVWLLMGTRAGDNNQLMSLAEALGFPFETKKIAFNQLRRLRFLRRGLLIVARESLPSIVPPWPDLVLCVGYGSVPVARYIREQSGGRAKLVHIGNPRDPLPDFDLQITTPQYSRQAPRLLELLFPIGNPARETRPNEEELAWLRNFPRPRRLVAIGGPARHWELDDDAIAATIGSLRDENPAGSLIVATSPRTRTSTLRRIAGLLGHEREVIVDDFPRFGTLLAKSDEIYVTADSVSMLSEAILSGKPVGMIPIRRSARGRLSYWFWQLPTGKPNLPNFPKFWRELEQRQLIGTVEAPVKSQVPDSIDCAAAAVRSVLGRGPSNDYQAD